LSRNFFFCSGQSAVKYKKLHTLSLLHKHRFDITLDAHTSMNLHSSFIITPSRGAFNDDNINTTVWQHKQTNNRRKIRGRGIHRALSFFFTNS